MSTIRAFRAVRPKTELATEVASPPYDVVSREEARQIAEGNPHCFLRIGRADLELPDTVDPYSDEVYQRGAENLAKMIESGVLSREDQPMIGVYRQKMGEHVQTGIVALASVAEYDTGLIKKHELTKPDKEADRARIIEIHNSQSGPVFLTYRQTPGLSAWFDAVTATAPEVDFLAADGIQHTVWAVRDSSALAQVDELFSSVPALYIADGHHRSAAASRVCSNRRPSREGSDWRSEDGFLAVVFPHDELNILPYNRVVSGLNGHTSSTLLSAISETFALKQVSEAGQAPVGGFEIYVDGQWHRATPRSGVVPDDPVGSLSVSILTDNVLAPILGIVDQRTDKRIDFVGGIRGEGYLQDAVDSGDWDLAFALYPTCVEELLAVADAGAIMPPKSTWFEPKLRDGLFIHILD